MNFSKFPGTQFFIEHPRWLQASTRTGLKSIKWKLLQPNLRINIPELMLLREKF